MRVLLHRVFLRFGWLLLDLFLSLLLIKPQLGVQDFNSIISMIWVIFFLVCSLLLLGLAISF